jgi:hypothetical protein
MNANEVKKELYKSKANAKFSHYTSGNLYYTVELSDGTYQFSIPATEQVADLEKQANDYAASVLSAMSNTSRTAEEMSAVLSTAFQEGAKIGTFKMSSDLGTTSFYGETKGSDLNRWIAKAIEKDDFVKI